MATMRASTMFTLVRKFNWSKVRFVYPQGPPFTLVPDNASVLTSFVNVGTPPTANSVKRVKCK